MECRHPMIRLEDACDKNPVFPPVLAPRVSLTHENGAFMHLINVDIDHLDTYALKIAGSEPTGSIPTFLTRRESFV